MYDIFRECGMAAVGWQLAAHATPGVGSKQLIALYQSAEPKAKQGTVVPGAPQVWRFVNDVQYGDLVVRARVHPTSDVPPGPWVCALIEHYDAADAETKRVVPLNRLHWPA
ncbi:hypothetical protein ISN34_12335 [Xanthomonas translucens pv. translucens]|uniref:Uncharacterized protein n=1 Tax=Xanthomonas translucens pv. translucens TaxID=134875 RepID=A0ABW9L0K8_XANCT|nr:hypothetical protein [Xanthomonas translucens]QSQ35271.1 hypothetical protein ISN31_06910 [Xanthomonas translucens pv. translucens]QSQ44083.1 hypothetical protein ISN34_12335 [Xanthomonas translucens pv. translucens]